MAAEILASVRQESAREWVGRAADPPVSVRGSSAAECARRVRAAVLARRPSEQAVAVVALVQPRLLGVAEAAEVLGWDKRRVVTYVDRGSFPQPLASLAGGRIWALDDVLAFREAFRARRRARRRRR